MVKHFKKTISLIIVVALAVSSFCFSVNAGAKTVSYPTPTSMENAELRFSLKLGSSYRDAPTPPVIAEGKLIVMSGKYLYKIDMSDGEIIKKAEMAETPSFSYTPPTYADGVVYCPLDNATIQAFDFRTLKSKWIYRDKSGGQSLTEIVADKGFIYTGFWNDETVAANYVCLSVKDEEKFVTDEEKTAVWTFTNKGGFYWAKAIVSGDFLIFGSDDGTVYDNKSSKLFCLDKKTGEVSHTLNITGDQRSGIAYDEATDRFYFVTKAGYLYGVKLENNGKFDTSSVRKLDLGGASTSTPSVHNGRIYVGVQGEGFGKGYLKVVDAVNLKEIYSVTTRGYVQNEVTVSVQDKEKTYVYASYNSAPGGICLITDCKVQTSAEVKDLFVPEEGQRNYCISPISVSSDGTLFYKNDSGYIFAVENGDVEQTSEKGFFEILSRIFNAIISFFKSILSFTGI